jgi:hypothetical protein
LDRRRHSSSPVCTPTAIDIIEIIVAVKTAVLWVRACVALVLLGWHGRRLLRGVP